MHVLEVDYLVYDFNKSGSYVDSLVDDELTFVKTETEGVAVTAVLLTF